MGVAGSVGLLSPCSDAVPAVQLRVNDVERRVMVDTGCSQCLVHVSCCGSWTRSSAAIVTMDGSRHQCMGVTTVCIHAECEPPKFVQALVVNFRPLNFDFILGMNGVLAFGGMCVRSDGTVMLGPRNSISEVEEADRKTENWSMDENMNRSGGVTGEIFEGKPVGRASKELASRNLVVDESDFVVRFDARTRQWTAAWKWTDDRQPDALKNCVAEYKIKPEAKEEYEKEIGEWMERGWLRRYDESKHGKPKGLIPLMAVVQKNKTKVRPVLDFRELNEHIQPFTANADVCAEKIRQWRKKGSNVALIDLTKAYLQIAMDEELWPYQTVVYEGERLCLTRLGFGLNVGPVIMRAVLEAVLKQDPVVHAGTSAYIDDVFVDESIVPAEAVKAHLEQFGLTCKAPERLREGTRVLGVRVEQKGDNLVWKRENAFGDVPTKLTRRTVFSLCGKLVGHLPVCGWLRVAAAYVKRRVNAVTGGWDDPVKDDGSIRRMLMEMVNRVHESDPAKGRWDVTADEMTVWTDASSLALGVVLEVDGCVVEDASWLRAEDATHINLAELDAAVKGVNMAIVWGAKKIRLFTDSKTVFHWVSDALSGKARLKTKASSEMLIRRRVALLVSLVTEYELDVRVEYVTSSCNLADTLTRVPSEWLKPDSRTSFACCAQASAHRTNIRAVHESCGHPGIRRTLYFARMQDPTVTRRQAREAVKSCEECQTVDPAPVRWTRGSLSVEEVWQRLAVDVTHVSGASYLTIVDCGPSRFAIWRQLRATDSTSVCRQLESVFRERGAPDEVLLDNATVFHSRTMSDLLEAWSVAARYRCAYEASGNGVVERNHRTIKTAVARSRFSVEEAVYWYNVTPKDDCTESTAPGARVYRYRMRARPVSALVNQQQPSGDDGPVSRVTARSSGGSYCVGDSVWVRRRGSRCTERSTMGTVTAVVSNLCVEVDGVPRHIRNLRPCERRSRRQSRPVGARRMSPDEDLPLLVTLPQESRAAETRPSICPTEPVPAEGRERTVFTLPSRSTARCLRIAPPRRQLQ